MMNLKKISIRYKIIMLIMVIFILSFGITFILFIINAKYRANEDLKSDGVLLAQVISDYVSAPLYFEIYQETSDILSHLKGAENIIYCAAYKFSGELFASYNPQKSAIPLEITNNYTDSIYFTSDKQLFIRYPVEYQGIVYGMLVLKLSSDMVTRNLRKLIITSLFILFSMLILVYFLALILQQIITQPILHLSKVTQKVIGRHDLSIRLKKKTDDEIGLLYDRFNQMLEQLQSRDQQRDETETKLLYEKVRAEEADKLKSAFLANMSHEIRTPMNSIIGFAGLLIDDSLEAQEKAEYIELINNSCNILLHLIDDILDISRIEAGQMQITYSDIQLKDIFDELYLSFREINQKENKDKVGLIVEIPSALNSLTVRTDEIRLRQIISNLLNNAIKFTDKGNIAFGYNIVESVKGNERYQKIKFFVRDTGIGIEDDTSKKIFERFTKVEADNSKLYRGAGLGLTISKKLVELLNGQIWVDSLPGKGSVFCFTLPYEKYEDSIQRAKIIILDTEQEKKMIPDLSGKKILIVEDEKSNFELLRALIRRTNADIFWAENGKKAIDMCDEYIFDMILMDIKMPELDGYKTVQILRKQGYRGPVVAQTAYARAEDETNILESGFDGYISKPIDRRKLFSYFTRFLKQ